VLQEQVEFRVLGPVDVLHGGRSIALKGSKRRALLAVLLLNAGDVVSVDHLVDGLWAEAAPDSAVNLIQTYVSLWRHLFDTELGTGAGQRRLARVGVGYRLDVLPGELDLRRFTELAERGRAARAAGELDTSVELLARALAQWRGDPLSDLIGEPLHASAAAHLGELRRQALVAWGEAAVDAGRAEEVTGDLQVALSRDRFDERLAEVLMRALYAQGRPADALAVFERTRRTLADELGADPGRDLVELHGQILQHDARLASPRAHQQVPRRALPLSADTFVGREAELAKLSSLVLRHRLVTLTGPGGSGKTRLAVEMAARLAAAGEDVAFVDAAPLSDAVQLPERIAAAVGVGGLVGRSVEEAVARVVAGRQLVVVIDSLEHLVGAAPVVSNLLQVASGLRVVATSREPLNLRAERRFPVAPLAISAEKSDSNAPYADGSASPAVALFVDRAAAVNPDFSLTAATVPAVVEICRRVDGLPLGIELAAGWSNVLSPAELLDRLDSTLDLLVGRSADRPHRQQTLRATIDWSYQLLDDDARQTLRTMSVFRGGCTLDAAAAVSGVPAVAILHQVRQLTDRGLLEIGGDVAGSQRFRLLETIREYGEQMAAQAGDQHQIRHADYYARLARECAEQLHGPDQARQLHVLEADHDNIRAALSWLAQTGELDLALEVAAGLWRFWQLRSHLNEGRHLLDQVLGAAGDLAAPGARARALLALGSVAYWQADLEHARTCYERAAVLFESAGDAHGIADAHFNVAFAALLTGERDAATRLFSDAVSRYRQLGDPLGLANAASGIGLVALVEGRLAEAAALVSPQLHALRALGDPFTTANCLTLLASIRRAQGRTADAEQLLQEAAVAHDGLGNVSGLAWVLRELSALALSRGDTLNAVRMAGAADAFDVPDHPRVPYEILHLPDVPSAARDALPAEVIEAAWQEGHGLTPRQAVELIATR
jgi:predicted ATPase/DNA-binding SARP family transcriptional activator